MRQRQSILLLVDLIVPCRSETNANERIASEERENSELAIVRDCILTAHRPSDRSDPRSLLGYIRSVTLLVARQ